MKVPACISFAAALSGAKLAMKPATAFPASCDAQPLVLVSAGATAARVSSAGVNPVALPDFARDDRCMRRMPLPRRRHSACRHGANQCLVNWNITGEKRAGVDVAVTRKSGVHVAKYSSQSSVAALLGLTLSHFR
jgi:hypothetical protein